MPTVEQEVIAFVADFTGVDQKKLKQESTLFGDLGVDGADGWELIEEFGKKFSVDLCNFRSDSYFGPEGLSLSAPFQWLWYFVSWPFRKERTPEEGVSMRAIRIADLIAAAQSKRWTT
jgi:acyl carrier protein